MVSFKALELLSAGLGLVGLLLKHVNHLLTVLLGLLAVFGFLLAQAGFVPGKTKKGGKHRKGTLTDDRDSAPANFLRTEIL